MNEWINQSIYLSLSLSLSVTFVRSNSRFTHTQQNISKDYGPSFHSNNKMEVKWKKNVLYTKAAHYIKCSNYFPAVLFSRFWTIAIRRRNLLLQFFTLNNWISTAEFNRAYGTKPIVYQILEIKHLYPIKNIKMYIVYITLVNFYYSN